MFLGPKLYRAELQAHFFSEGAQPDQPLACNLYNFVSCTLPTLCISIIVDHHNIYGHAKKNIEGLALVKPGGDSPGNCVHDLDAGLPAS
jgi:hypothetical protein